jgi:hypothetical protein
MKRLLAILLVVVLAVGAFLLFPRGEELSAAIAATISVLRGDVDAQKGGAGDFSPALDGDLFASGDVVRSQQQGRAVLTFFDGSTLSVEPGSHVKVVSLARVGADGIQVVIEQTIGRTWASVERLKTPDSKFELRTPTSTAAVRGTAFETLVELINGVTTTTILTTEGEVVARAVAGGETTVAAGQQVQVAQGQAAPAQAQAQPPAPRIQFVGSAGLSYVVKNPNGQDCGSSANLSARTIPRCDVQGQTVVISNPVAGTYSLVLTAAQALPNASLILQGLRGATKDFEVNLARSVSLGELVRTTVPIGVGADSVLTSTGFTPVVSITSVCGAEALGRVFSSGAVAERTVALQSYGQQNKSQPASLVVTQDEVTQVAQEGLANFQGPATISGLAVTIDSAGLHLNAQAAAGPLTVPAKGAVIAGASGGKLLLRIRTIDMGPVPGAIKDQILTQINAALAQFAASFPLTVERVALRPGCFAIIGTTPP